MANMHAVDTTGRRTPLKQSALLKSNWLVGIVTTLLFLSAHFTGFTPLLTLEMQVYDRAVKANMRAADGQIVLITIDDNSISRLGNWPWPQPLLSKVMAQLATHARLIGLDIFYHAAAPPDEQQTLARTVRDSGNILLPVFFNISGAPDLSNAAVPDFVSRMNIRQVNRSNPKAAALIASDLRFSFPQLSAAAAGLGHLSMRTDVDGILRTDPLAVEYSGQLFPSMSLALAAKSLNIPMSDIRINLGTDIELGAMNILTDQHLRIYPRFYGDGKGKSFATYSFYDVHSGRIPLSAFDNKIVLIGMTATGISNAYHTPVNTQMTDVEFNANTLQSILKEGYFSRPSWAGKVELAILLFIGLYLTLLLPRLNAVIATATTLILLAILLGSSFMLLTGMALWLQTATAACLLLSGHLLLSGLKFGLGMRRRRITAADSNETNKMLGLSFQGQGMLDMAFDKFRTCPVNDEILSMLYSLALDFERKRQLGKAETVYEYMTNHGANYRDIRARLENIRNSDDATDSSDSNSSGLSALLMTAEGKPMLGRYEIIRELGKGAMGTVYLGMDPKINREVAIKVMPLSQDFEPCELEEVKKRFFHEAEIAGMLNHQNIVTIFDAGDEHDLAYIAMEFLNGIDLAPYTRPEKLLPPATVLKIIGKVAVALAYAHKQGVIHRDIKPANIMVLKNKTVKVTDFGIAHITEQSKTKAGIVMGTPSYMSPEQLAGQNVDGRSDLFSLGVTLYELLSGVRPFRADSISKLMFIIAKEPHPDIRKKCPDLPESICSLIDRMLRKRTADRIATSDEVIEGIMQGLRDLEAREKTIDEFD